MYRSSMSEIVDVVVRCRNEMPYARPALEALVGQEGVKARLLVIDCRSEDGSREVAAELGLRVHDLDPRAYIPGRVLNMGMEMTESPVVAFVNADAIARDRHALERLVAPLADRTDIAATYGRQTARPDADPLTKLDYSRAFAEESELATRFGGFFSMAASAIRRDAWAIVPFDTELRYSEDVDWTARVRALGWKIQYVPDAAFEHSHVYDLGAHFKRRIGEGTADTHIFRLGKPSLVRDFARPLAGSVLRDVRAGVASPQAIVTRAAQAYGYFVGRRRAHAGASFATTDERGNPRGVAS